MMLGLYWGNIGVILGLYQGLEVSLAGILHGVYSKDLFMRQHSRLGYLWVSIMVIEAYGVYRGFYQVYRRFAADLGFRVWV